MRLVAMVFAATLLVASTTSAQVPDEFVLYQNEPDPFCPSDSLAGTAIRLQLPRAAYIQLEVWSPDTTSVVRTLIEASLPAGFHELIWDGRDVLGEFVDNGVYPYTMTASDSPGGEVLSEQTLLATVECDSPVASTTWGWLKAWYRRVRGPTSN